MSKRNYVVAALAGVLVSLAVGAGVVAGVGSPKNVGAFTLKKTITIYRPDGTREVRREIYRRASDGSFRIIETDGQKIFADRGFAQGRGFFTVDHGSRTLWRHPDQRPNRPPLTADARPLVSDPNFVGTETVLGRTAYHIRHTNARGGVDTDSWYLPETGGVPFKQVAYRADGGVERSAEPYSLEFAEPEPTFVRLPDFPAADPAPPSK